MHDSPKIQFFDSIAGQWDGWHDLEELASQLAGGLDELGVGGTETVLDVGCGTGNLTRALLERLSAAGRVEAADISPAMVSIAERKITDPRVRWHIADAAALPLPDASVDRVICFSVWPHFDDPDGVAHELARVLRPGGAMHVWHLASRATINEIHAGASEAVRSDVLAPATATARLLEQDGLVVRVAIDDGSRYLVTAVKRTAPG